MNKTLRWTVMFLVALCLASATWLLCSPRLLFWVNSPQGVYRLEFYGASLAQRLRNRELLLPGFFRLHRISPPHLMAEGPVVDLLVNSKITWPRVEDGLLAVELFQKGLANIPPECVAPCQVTAPSGPSNTVKP